MARPPPRPIRRLLVCNRGEIATRIMTAARELSIPTYAVYTSNDATHVRYATRAIELPSASSYMDIPYLISLIKQHNIDAVHPGYGFLSESAEFARRVWDEAGAVVVGPGWEILEQTGDKLKARKLAEECSVPVTPALLHPTSSIPTSSIPTLRAFASSTGYPVMIKAVDGGGGRGIRLVHSDDELEQQATRAIEESPSRRVYAEQAMVDGFRHVEVQMVGDGRGEVRHLWERECSVQRRWQKVVEEAPSTFADRGVVGEVIAAAVRMAERLSYFSLGTFEFLVHPRTRAFYFLEINPRLQVEHTVTESLVPGLDLVQTQLLLHHHQEPSSSSSSPLLSCPGIPPTPLPPSAPPPPLHSLQLRLTAEDPSRAFALSPGPIHHLSFASTSGPGVRIDTHHPSTIGTDFDSLIAKIVVTACSRAACIRKAARVLADVQVAGGAVKTNLGVLRGVVASAAFGRGECDTRWLEGAAVAEGLVAAGEEIGRGVERGRAEEGSGFGVWEREEGEGASGGGGGAAGLGAGSNAAVLFRKGNAWNVTLEASSLSLEEGDGVVGGQAGRAKGGKALASSASPASAPTHHLEITRVLRNDFPSSLSAEIAFSSTAAADVGASSSSSSSSSTPYVMHIAATTASSSAALSQHRRGRPDDPSHVCIPFAGKVVEVLVDEGDSVREGDVICVVRQMKMELEVRSPRPGRATWVFEGEEGEEVSEGTLACVLELESKEKARL
ncbi:putative carboxylase:pyruvate acetyl-CoA/propionyl-CoA [Diplodia corticola]|uniref:Putative carboxylase:pyruvate acetyl-CoA/propionyl-CoA n=1 Tax=Diplodia corticola TaxID=236234 RepID=A0A1J9R8X7_9PEZI|nr:putative carboxylase:pyruvate acetyl-CoA/propionyl-CoA [Diplodia corticola]OJD36626.1 putative carboxylase:pyruvate acetyl-CoA/propionyl-CoA [Diplodia corticola]